MLSLISLSLSALHKDKTVKKENNYLDYWTNQSCDENKYLFDYLSKITYIHCYTVPDPLGPTQTLIQHYYQTPDTYGSLQTHTQHYYLIPDPSGSTQTELYTYLVPYPLYSLDTFGSSLTQTPIEPDPPTPTQTLTYSHISHNTFGTSQTQTHIYIEPDPPTPTQTLTYLHLSHNTFGPHTFSHILHDTLGIIKTEIYTYLVSDSRYSFNIFGSAQYLILFSFVWCVHYNKKTKGTNPRTGIG